MTPESLKRQIEAIAREALCAWDDYAGCCDTCARDAEIADLAWQTLVDQARPPINVGCVLVTIEILERRCGRAQDARRVRALLDQVQRDREAVDCG